MTVKLDNSQIRELDEVLDWYLSSWGPVDWSGIRGTSVMSPDADLGRMLLALSQIEADSQTMRKKLAATGGDNLSQLREFIIVWLAEEGEHARALEQLAHNHGVTSLGEINRRRLGRDARAAVTWPGLYLSRSIPGMCAVYTTLGAMQELVALTTYNELAKIVDDESSRLLKAIARQESHHMRFYKTAAEIFLRNSPSAQRATRQLISKLWRPPGMDLLGRGSFEEIFGRLLRTPSYAAGLADVDRIASSLPGLGEVNVMRRYLSRENFEIGNRRRNSGLGRIES